MLSVIKLTLLDIFRWKNGEICILCDAEPKPHPLITRDFPAKIVVEGVTERPLNLMGQEIFVRHKVTERNSKTTIRINDNIDDILEYVGKKKIIIYVEVPDEIKKAMELSMQKHLKRENK